MPENRKPPAGTGGISENDQLAGDLPNRTNDLAAVADATWPILVGQMLTSMPLPVVRGLLEQLPAVSHPVLAWWVTGIQLAVDHGIIPNPLTASMAAITAGYPPPPALRGLVVSAGWALSAEASSVPFPCAQDLIDIVRGAEVRRAAEKALTDMHAVIWTADLTELTEVFQRHTATVLAMLAEVNR